MSGVFGMVGFCAQKSQIDLLFNVFFVLGN